MHIITHQQFEESNLSKSQISSIDKHISQDTTKEYELLLEYILKEEGVSHIEYESILVECVEKLVQMIKATKTETAAVNPTEQVSKDKFLIN